MQICVQTVDAIDQIILGSSVRQQEKLFEHCSISSDSFGSLPVFNAAGQLVKYEVRSLPTQTLRTTGNLIALIKLRI